MVRWLAVVCVVVTIAAASLGQALVAAGKPAFFFPPATGMYQFPFRQARERTTSQQPRTEVACESPEGVLGWRAFDEQILDRMAGPHHRKVAFNQVLSDSLAGASAMRVKRVVTRLACADPALTTLLRCSGRGEIALRNRDLDGAITREFHWTCPIAAAG